jgi:hypothetical protein
LRAVQAGVPIPHARGIVGIIKPIHIGVFSAKHALMRVNANWNVRGNNHELIGLIAVFQFIFIYRARSSAIFNGVCRYRHGRQINMGNQRKVVGWIAFFPLRLNNLHVLDPDRRRNKNIVQF